MKLRVKRASRILNQLCASFLIVLIVPFGAGTLFAQQTEPQPQMDSGRQAPGPPPPPPTQAEIAGQSTPQGQQVPQPLTADQLDQLVAPIALYPDALVAQILAASTYPAQVVEADRWIQAQGDVPADQLAEAANGQNWDPSVKALVAFPSVLTQMDNNIGWTTDLGNAYYNQPDDVMNAVQAMRMRAQAAGNLQTTPQETVSEDDGDIAIVPADDDVVYVPIYDPWTVYGAPLIVFPGYYWQLQPAVYFATGFAVGFGIGIVIGTYSRWGWGYHHWRCNWRSRTVVYNRSAYVTRSRTVINRGLNRPRSPRGFVGQRGVEVSRANPIGSRQDGILDRRAAYSGARPTYRRVNPSPAYAPGRGVYGRSIPGPTPRLGSTLTRNPAPFRATPPAAVFRGGAPARSEPTPIRSGYFAGGSFGGEHPAFRPH